MLRLSSHFSPNRPDIDFRRLSEETENIDKQVNGQFPIGEKEEKPLTSGIEDVRGEF